jgi:transposase, IS30 family
MKPNRGGESGEIMGYTLLVFKSAKEYRMSVKTYHHLTSEERWQIKALLASGQSLRNIAKQLGRSVSTICNEKKRGFISDSYSPVRSVERYEYTRKKSGMTRRKLQGRLWQDVRECLHLKWSPEQISGRFKAIGLAEISHTSIYAQIYRVSSAGLRRCLRHGGKKYAHSRAGKSLIPGRVDISERPDIVKQKQRIGDWEGDTIVGSGHKGAIVSLADRASKYTLLQHVERKCAEPVKEAIIQSLKNIKDKVHTITYDNGTEFVQHQKVNEVLDCQSYFATPYHSWERGLNEHTNGL